MVVMSKWLDLLPSHEKAKIRARCRSPEEYERLRERVKGPEDLEREMKINESFANLSFLLETQPKLKEEFCDQVRKDIKESGVDKVLEESVEIGEEIDIAVQEDPDTREDRLVLILPGKVREVIPINKKFSEKYLKQFT